MDIAPESTQARSLSEIGNQQSSIQQKSVDTIGIIDENVALQTTSEMKDDNESLWKQSHDIIVKGNKSAGKLHIDLIPNMTGIVVHKHTSHTTSSTPR